jgi:dTDP-4-amino-4,6-dideoxygalactose transaminase
LADVPGIRCLAQTATQSKNHAYFPVLVGQEYPMARDALYAHLKAQGIHGRRYFYPLISDFPMYRGLPSAQRSNLPVATEAASQVLCLPIYPSLATEDVERIIDLIRTAKAD